MSESNYDGDGFLSGNPSPRSPHRVDVPKFFDGCVDRDDAIRKMINELQKEYSAEYHGIDTMYRNMANALILLLSILGDYAP